jgi:hybrid cluster-associated redox disulfide protein
MTDALSKKEQPINKGMNLAEVVFKYPEVAEVFTDYGLHCVGCFASGFDTIEMGAKIHQLSSEEVDEMIARANEVVLHEE